MTTDVIDKDQAKSVRRARKLIEPTAQRRKIWKRHHSRLTQLMRWRLCGYALYASFVKALVDAGELSVEFYPLDPNDTRPSVVLDKQSVYNLYLEYPTKRMRRILARYSPMLPVSVRKEVKECLRVSKSSHSALA